MGLPGANDIELRFSRYVEELVSVIGHADRAGPFRDYCTGLVMPGERKSVEPMAAITAPGRTAAQHQSLLHFVGQGAWSDDDVLTKVRQMVLPQMTRDGPIEAHELITANSLLTVTVFSGAGEEDRLFQDDERLVRRRVERYGLDADKGCFTRVTEIV